MKGHKYKYKITKIRMHIIYFFNSINISWIKKIKKCVIVIFSSKKEIGNALKNTLFLKFSHVILKIIVKLIKYKLKQNTK